MARFAFASAIVLLAAFCSAASLTSLGSGPTHATMAFGISADGSAVTGVYRTETDEVFRWSHSSGLVKLGVLQGDISSSPMAISANGNAIAGNSLHYIPSPVPNDPDPLIDAYRGFHWTASTGMVDIGLAPGSYQSFVTAMSADGSSVFGHSGFLENFERRAFRWTASTGIQPLDSNSGFFDVYAVSGNGSVAVGGHNQRASRWTESTGVTPLAGLEEFDYSYARAVSTDGSAIVGFAGQVNGTARAFRWTAASGSAELLPDITGEGHLVSADGAVVAGTIRAPFRLEAFRWAQSSGSVPLGYTPIHGDPLYSDPRAMSADGSVLVGTSSSPYDNAFFWDATHGMQFLKNVLIAQGVPDMAGWKLDNPTGISADGTTVVGYGYNFDPAGNGNIEAWVAVIPEPSSLLLAGLSLPIALGRRR